jgi:hypothetical protein
VSGWLFVLSFTTGGDPFPDPISAISYILGRRPDNHTHHSRISAVIRHDSSSFVSEIYIRKQGSSDVLELGLYDDRGVDSETFRLKAKGEMVDKLDASWNDWSVEQSRYRWPTRIRSG